MLDWDKLLLIPELDKRDIHRSTVLREIGHLKRRSVRKCLSENRTIEATGEHLLDAERIANNTSQFPLNRSQPPIRRFNLMTWTSRNYLKKFPALSHRFVAEKSLQSAAGL